MALVADAAAETGGVVQTKSRLLHLYRNMHLASGLQFKAVAVVARDDAAPPLRERIDDVADETEIEDIYKTEGRLLYVATTRARDCLLVTGVKPGSDSCAVSWRDDQREHFSLTK